jgi:hypothetical protein
MRPRALGIATLSLFALLIVSTAAFAAKPAFEAEPLAPGPFESITPGPPLPNGPCTMGVNTGAAFIINYLLPPDDAYYTLIDPANCSCPNGSIAINAAHLLLNFQAVCAQNVVVTIVPAIDVNGCLQPDPSAPICGPYAYTLAPGATGNFQFNLPIPQGCCITQKAFLGINFIAPGVGCSTAATRPRLITNASCAPCTSWNIYPGGFDDLCVDAGFPGNPLMWADGDCCSTTPAGKQTWGQVKNLYR